MAGAVGRYPGEPFIVFEQPVQRLQLVQVFCAEWPSFVLPNESSEPFAKASRLSRDVVELSRHRLGAQGFKRISRYELRLLQPGQETVAVVDPVDFDVHWGSNRIQEIQTERVGEEHGGRPAGSHLCDLSVRNLGHLRRVGHLSVTDNLSVAS